MRRSLVYILSLAIILIFGMQACDEATTEPDDDDMEAPTVSLTVSAQEDTISGEVTLTAEASDNDQVDSVQFYVDDQRLGTATSSPFEYDWQTLILADSMSHELYAKAYDPAGNSAESSKISRVIVPFMVSLSTNVQPIFDANCTGCHPGNGGLSLTSGQAYGDLVDIESNGYAPMNRVVPGSPENSVLYLKVIGDQQVGQRMPQGGPPLPDESIALIRFWIEQGAEDN